MTHTADTTDQSVSAAGDHFKAHEIFQNVNESFAISAEGQSITMISPGYINVSKINAPTPRSATNSFMNAQGRLFIVVHILCTTYLCT